MIIPDSVQIREATRADIPALVALLHAAFEEYRGLLDPASSALTETGAGFADLLETETVMVATTDEEVVGVVFCDMREDPVWLYKLAVLPTLRGRGIGKNLVAAVEAGVARAERRRVNLAARIPLVANQIFYMDLGYSIVEARAHTGYDLPTFYVMSKELANPKPRDQRLIEVVPHDPAWADHYTDEAARLRGALGSELIDIHHIGSTAIIGIHAKPIIDILPVMRDIRVLDTLIPTLSELGYEAKGEYGISGRRYFRRVINDRHTHHVHAFEVGHPDIARHVDFCAYLNANPGDAQRYADIKRRMAVEHPHDIVAYNDGKGPLIREIEGKMQRA